jgi:hypothetical protein
MRFYWGSVVGHTYAYLQSPRDGREGDQSGVSQDPHFTASDNILENERETDTDDPDFEFTLDDRNDDDWDGAHQENHEALISPDRPGKEVTGI